MTDDSVDLQPVLEGPRLTVRPVVPEDWHGMFAAAADPRIWEVHPAYDRYKEPVFRSYFDDALRSKSAFTIVDRTTSDIIGSSRYNGYDPAESEIEIGWTFLTRDYWGGSYNQEVKSLMTGHAFSFVETVIFWVGETNFRSRRAMEKIGGSLRAGTHTRGGGAAHVVYELTRP